MQDLQVLEAMDIQTRRWAVSDKDDKRVDVILCLDREEIERRILDDLSMSDIHLGAVTLEWSWSDSKGVVLTIKGAKF